MKKIMIVIIISILMFTAGCVDYSTVNSATEPTAEVEPVPSEVPMVALDTFEALEDENAELKEYIEQLEGEQLAANQEKDDLMDEVAIIDAALKQLELSVYRSVIAKDAEEQFFGAIKAAEQKDNGDIVIEVDVLELVNEKIDSLYYSLDEIEDINENLTFDYANKMTLTLKLDQSTIIRYDGMSYPNLDGGFYAYLTDQITQAEVEAEAAEGDAVVLSGPVFILVTMEDNALMVLEK